MSVRYHLRIRIAAWRCSCICVSRCSSFRKRQITKRKKKHKKSKNKAVQIQKQAYLIIAMGTSPVAANIKKIRPGKKSREALQMRLAAAPTAEWASVSIMPAPMNTTAYSFFSTSKVSFVRRIGIVINDRPPIQTATRRKKNNNIQVIV